MSKYRLEVQEVDGDDYGDKQWTYYYELYDGDRLVWQDYTRVRPRLHSVLKELQELGEL